MYYPYTIKIVRKKIKSYSQTGRMSELEQKTIDHIRWMLDEIDNMGSNQSAKAGRWIGWILANLEFMSIITNKESRNIVRIDVSNSND